MHELELWMERTTKRLLAAEGRIGELERHEARRIGPLGWYLTLSQLRAFWPMSSVDESENVYDASGQGRTLSPQTDPSFGTEGLIPYLLLNGSHYLSRADEAGLRITGALTLGAWFYFDTLGSAQALIYKLDGALNSYYIVRDSNGFPQFGIYNSNTHHFITGTTAIATATWTFIVGRFTPNSELKVWANTNTDTNTSSIPGSIDADTAPLTVGATGGGGAILDGRVAFPFICAAAVSDEIVTNLFENTRHLFGV